MSNAGNTHSVPPIRIHGSNVSKPIESLLKGTGTNATLVLIDEYIQTLTPFERQGLAIAKDHLGPSFDMKRSTGFLRWKDSKNNKKRRHYADTMQTLCRHTILLFYMF